MEKELNTTIIYQTWFESIALFGEEKQIKAMMQIIRYGLYGEIPDNHDDKILQALLMTWCAQVDAYKRKLKGGAPIGNKNAVGNKGGPGRPKKHNPKTQPLNIKDKDNGNINANYHYPLPSVDTPASDGAGDTTSGSEQDDEWWRNDG